MYTYTEDQIDAQITIVARDAGRLQDKIHALGFATLRAYRDAKDQQAASTIAATRLSNLQAASPYHSDAFSKWVAKFMAGRMIWNDETKVWVAHETDFAFTGKEAKAILKDAKALPFYELKPASQPKPYDDIETFIKFADALEAKVKKADKDDNITVHPAFVNKVRELRRAVTEAA